MTNPKKLIFVAILFVFCLASLAAYALPMHARSIIYFDQNNHIIGQQVLYCNNISHHAGNIDVSNPYRIEEEFGCNDPYVQCKANEAGTTTCTRTGVNENGSYVAYFNAAGGYTLAQYCSSGPSGPFEGHPDCGMPAPSELSVLQPNYSYGWQ